MGFISKRVHRREHLVLLVGVSASLYNRLWSSAVTFDITS